LNVRPELVDRFRADVARLTGAAPLGIAVSGGPDSMALLLLAAAAFPGQVRAATVDHGLRREAAAEAALVARTCAGMSVPHRTLVVEVPRQASIQAAARRSRYERLAAWCREEGLPLLATAHHADDQAETLLMRMGRGAGIAGLSGIRVSRDLGGVRLVRPLLGWRRSELAAIVAGIETVSDPSNLDPRYDRVRMRALLARAGPDLDAVRVAAAASHLAAADEALDWVLGEALRSRVERIDGGRTLVDLADLPPEVARRLLERLIGQSDSPPDGPTLETALARLAEGRHASIGRLRLSPGNRILIENAPPRSRKQEP